MEKNEVIFRRGKEGDAPEIANVHLNSWREAYRGLLPQSYLDGLPLTFKRRMAWWEKVIKEPHEYSIHVAEAQVGIVGFAVFGSAREEGMKEFGELGAIYLMEKFKGQVIGYKLLSLGMKDMIDRGYQKVYCWVRKSDDSILREIRRASGREV
jgi:ribosomal protein S18 acetylase RimI-like enzyme